MTRRQLIVLATFALFLGAAPAGIAAKNAKSLSPCTAVAHETTICKQGRRTFRIIHGSFSPSKRYAVAWTIEGGDNDDMDALSQDPLFEDRLQERSFSTDNRDHVWNYLIRLSDGKVMGKLDGRHFGDRQRYNNYTHQMSWSPNERFVVQVTDWRFGSSFASAYRIDGSRLTGPLKLTPPTRHAASSLLKDSKDKDYVSKVPGTFEIVSLENDGTMKLSIQFAEPKEDGFSFDATVKIVSMGNMLKARFKSIAQKKE